MHKLIEIAGKSVNHPLNPGLKFQTNKKTPKQKEMDFYQFLLHLTLC